MRVLFLLSSLFLLFCGVVLPTLLGALWPDYNPVASYLSELGADGAPHATWMNYAGFVPVAVLWSLCVILLASQFEKGGLKTAGVLLLLGTSLSYGAASVFHCDAGCPTEGSPSQMIHNLVGVIGYGTALPGLLCFGFHTIGADRRFSMLTFLASAVFAFGFLTLLSPEASHVRGLAQRFADFTLFFWMLAAAVLQRPESER
jgi:hypothetical protein